MFTKIRRMWKSPLIFLGLLLMIMVIIPFVSNSFVNHQQYDLYCHELAWGLNKSQVRDRLADIGSLNWREFAIEGMDIEKVQLSFKDPWLGYRFGGVLILYFTDKSYYSAVVPVPVGEEKGICKKPE
jgi:hypothetical protein